MRILAALLFLVPGLAQAALVDPALNAFARQEGGMVRVLALMEYPTNRPLPSRDPRAVRRYLRQVTGEAMTRVQQGMGTMMNTDVRVVSVHHINNSFMAQVTPNGLKALARVPGVSKVYADRKVEYTRPVHATAPAARRFTESMPYDIVQMELDKMWAQNPQVLGTGVLVGHIDTGVDGKHPALAGKIAAFYDAKNRRLAEPFDDGDHGTHTAGTVVGNPRDGIPMGVAPNARMVSAAALSGYDDMLAAMEFMMDPDSNPDTNDFPRLVTNSWNCQGAPDLEAFYRAISAWEAAGILTVFSAGNSGPGAQTITKPHEHPYSFSVGATDANAKIASFSSRGPGIFNGQKTAKPDVSAPGVNIVSALPGGRYGGMSGTSMAAPHVAGLAALMYQVAPGLTPQKMRELIMQSSNYVDQNGNQQANFVWNANYGFGRVSALRALAAVQNLRGQLENRWGAFMNPALDIVEGFRNMTDLTGEKVGVAHELTMSFTTDASNWTDGEML